MRRSITLIWACRDRLAELALLFVVATILHLLLILLIYRLATEPMWLAHQYLGPVQTEDEIWGRVVSGALLLLVIGWGVFCTAFVCLDLHARRRGVAPRVKMPEWIAGAGAAVMALALALLAVRGR
jgi:hypothetical protein